MKMPRKSVWLSVMLAVYATAFFAYKFFVQNVGATPRNVAVVAVTYVLVVMVWLLNHLNEKRQDSRRNPDGQ